MKYKSINILSPQEIEMLRQKLTGYLYEGMKKMKKLTSSFCFLRVACSFNLFVLIIQSATISRYAASGGWGCPVIELQ